VNIYRCGIKEKTLMAIKSYIPEIINFPESVIALFVNSLVSLEQLGVDELALRSVNSDGSTRVFSTSLPWHNIRQELLFKKIMKEHMESELFSAKQENLKLIIRSPCRVDSEYLGYLNDLGLNNSIVKFDFDNLNVIKIIFLISDTPSRKDKVLNNLTEIEQILQNLQPFTALIETSQAFQESEFLLLSENYQKMLFDNGSLVNKNGRIICYKGRMISLSPREDECFSYLGWGMSNKAIAAKIGTSPFTVKDQISSVRRKFGGVWRNELSSISREESIRRRL
jgi:DNA-binding CsgD family transcriptional regulator